MFATIVLSLATLGAALPIKGSNNNGTVPHTFAVADQYTAYQGDGSTDAGWPSDMNWGSYDELWAANSALMTQSCGWNGWGADNSADEINGINSAIQQVSGETGVDSRFILAIVMQESKGCVRAPTTDNGVVNPGLMQSHNGSGTCAGVNPCPQDQIVQMIRDGTAGTANGDGLQQTHARASSELGDAGSRSYYAAARLYNSGSVDYTNLNNGFTSTACYAMDVANRLTGWTLAASGCNV
ncbi:hypothetical protein N3K66_008925 [Trichothecium roseum]|uniref:Uncharacterized protein n=1 Tax=Trichothecium roseum TaxID=47278 RepID=A0ACC0URX9_9HYPO|nr:hypothetical protein N3K66_008925 [Trichothecium roseum]